MCRTKMEVACYLAVLLMFIGTVTADCPHLLPGLTKWSEASSWENGIPAEGDDIIITSNILLDGSPGVDLNSIVIPSGGQLVFAPDSNITLRTKYIHIDGGRMDIGSEDCLYTGKARIQLLGTEDEIYSVPGFDRKFIGVDVDGTLEIHGERKLSWTKLSSTLHKLTPDAFASSDKIDKTSGMKGLIVKSYNPATGEEDREQGVFPIGAATQKKVDKATEAFTAFLDDIPDGNVVMMAVRKFIVDRQNQVNRSQFYDAVETFGYGQVTMNSKIRDLVFYDGFCMIAIKGSPSRTVEGFEPYKVGGLHQTSTATLFDSGSNLKYFTKSYTKSRGFGKSFAEFEVSYIDKAVPTLTLIDDVSSWREGDMIFVTSTDFDWEQVEIGTLVPCPECAANQIRVDLSPRHTHFGEIFKNVDMRAEVAVLTRNVVIEGVMQNIGDEFGGQIKVLKGFKNFHIEGAEIVHMGQSGSKGKYPIHWHMCEDVDELTQYPEPTYARENSIHQSYARCVTVHATHGATVSDNVCFDSIGHGFFLEDGGEKRTTLRGNLGAGQLQGKLIPTDSMPTTFWITNPLTILENNVAAGGEGYGIWYVFPDEPMGPSKEKGYMALDEAKYTAITKFENNVAHSNEKDGLRIENRLEEDGMKTMNNKYRPLNDPKNLESGDKKVQILRLTAYKNREANSVIRGGLIEVKDSSFADSPSGLQFRRFSSGQSVLNSVFIGDSDNIGEPDQGFDRSLPNPDLTNVTRRGLVLGTGPQLASNVWFGGFANTDLYDAGGIAFNHNEGMTSSPRNIISIAGFGFDDASEGNRVFPPSVTGDIPDTIAAEMFYDENGDVTSVPGSAVVRPTPFLMTSNCELRANWELAICNERFARVDIKGYKDNSVTMIRTDDMTSNRQTSDDKGNSHFNVVIGGPYSYLLKFSGDMPSSFSIAGRGMDNDLEVVIAVCVPKDAVLGVKYKRPEFERGQPVATLADLEADVNGDAYFLDQDVGALFVKLFNTESFSSEEIRNCPKGQCSFINVAKIAMTDTSDTDCETAFATKYGSQSAARRRFGYKKSLSLPHTLGKTSVDPPANVGAGSTKN